MKTPQILKILAGSAMLSVAAACNGNTSATAGSTPAALASAAAAPAAAYDNTPITVSVTGDLNVDLPKEKLVGREASVTFNRFPASLAQFEGVLPTLKQTPQGAVVAQLMAMELYRLDPEAGKKAFGLCNVASNVPSIMSRVPDLFGHSSSNYDNGDTRPYQVASFLQGANRDNGYNPKRPYTVKMKVSANGAIYSETYQAKVLYLQVATQGTDLGYRGCEVINTKKPGEPSGWIVFNCPGLYVRCKAIGFDATFKGLD